MTHLFGTYISENKSLSISLTNLYGIGKKQAISICKTAGINPKVKINQLTKQQLDLIIVTIESNHTIDSELKKELREIIQKFVSIQCYRGIRHFQGLPLRGQRTSTNGRTQKRLGSFRAKRR